MAKTDFDQLVDLVSTQPAEPPIPDSDPRGMDGLVDLVTRPDSTALHGALYGAADANPSEEARRRQQARQLGIGSAAVPSDAEARIRQRQHDPVKIMEETPAVGKFLSNPNNAKLAIDSVGNLQALERTAKAKPRSVLDAWVKDPIKSAISGAYTAAAGVIEAQHYIPSEIITDKFLSAVAPRFAQQRRDFIKGLQAEENQLAQDWQKRKSADIQQRLEQYQKADLFDTVTMLATDPGLMADQLAQSTVYLFPGAAAARGGSGAVLAYNTLVEAMDAANSARQEAIASGVSEEGQDLAAARAALVAAPVAFLGNKLAGTGLLETEFFTKGRTGHTLVQTILREGVSGAAEEGGNQLGVNIGARTVYDVNRDPFANVGKAAVVGGLLEATHGVGMSTAEYTLRALSNRIDGARAERVAQVNNAYKAEQDFKVISELAQQAADDPMRKLDAEAFQEFVDTMVEDTGTLAEVYVPAQVLSDTLQAAGMSVAEIQAKLPVTAGQLQEALVSGGEVRVPLSEYLTHIAPTSANEALLPLLRTTPDGMTYADAQAFYQTQVEQDKKIADQIALESEPVLSEEEFTALQQARAIERASKDIDAVTEQVGVEDMAKAAEAVANSPEAVREVEALLDADAELTYDQYLANHKNQKAVEAADVKRVQDTIVRQLEATQRFPKAVNTAYAIPFREFYVQNAKRMGLRPSELFDRIPISFVADSMGLPNLFAQEEVAATVADFNPENVRDILRKHNWAILTAENPNDTYTPDDNPERMAQLREFLDDNRVQYLDVDGRYNRDEKSIILFNVTPRQALDIGRRFNQESVLTRDGLVYQNGDITPTTGEVEVFGSGAEAGGDFFTSIPELGTVFRVGLDFDTTLKMGEHRAPVLPPDTEGTDQGADTIDVDGVARPVQNSNGQRIAQTEEGLRNFWRWFGDSKVVTSSGKPRVVYHGTKNAGFTKFDTVGGAFFHSNFSLAADYGGMDEVVFSSDGAGVRGERALYEVYLSLKNPKVLDFDGQKNVNGPEGLTLDDWVVKAKRAGYDGVIAENIEDLADGSATEESVGTVSVAFSPTQIKSATDNQGTFDPNNPNILYQTGGKQGEVSVLGVHFSREQRPVLRGNYYGTGIRGAEAKRLGDTKDTRLRQRLHFYVDEGQGVFPEGGVGSVKHTVQLDNLYDAASNPQQFPVKNAYGEFDFNVFETAVLDAGFSGYYIREGFTRQGVAVLLGKDASNVVPQEAKQFNQSAYHGSPHRHNKFSLKHVGSGEGAQAFGWGLYFASLKEIAEHYRKSLIPRAEIKSWKFGTIQPVRNGEYTDYSPRDGSDQQQANALLTEDLLIREADIVLAYEEGGIDAARKVMDEVVDERIKYAQEDQPALIPYLKIHKRKLASVLRFEVEKNEGQLYKVEIPDDDTMLLWDERLDNQPEQALAGLRKFVEATQSNPERVWAMLNDPYEFRNFGEIYDRLAGMNPEGLSRGLSRMGVSGIKYLSGVARTTGEPDYNYVVFDDEQITITETFYQTSQGWYYSQLARAIDQAKQDIQPAAQWKTWLNANAAKFGVKQDEIQWTGIVDWLDLQQGKVSKADVKAYLDGNGVRVEEVVLGESKKPYWGGNTLFTNDGKRLGEIVDEGATYKWAPVGGDQIDTGASRMFEATGFVTALYGDQQSSDEKTKYSEYTVPGGKNYKELLLTLPQQDTKMEGSPEHLAYMAASDDLLLAELNGESQQKLLELDRAVRKAEAAFDAKKASVRANTFRSSHFDQPNILAHVRFDERTDADGNRVLFIHEVQADKGQAWEKLRKNILAGKASQSEKERFELLDKNFPFNKTDAWVSLSIKRMIAYAVDNGFDKVAFINGQQAADLYDLSKQVDSVKYSPNGDGTYNVFVLKGHEIPWSDNHATPKTLEDTLGKEIAKKITDDPKEGIISGLDLKVGGEGMRAFYDQIVPQVANDVLRKVGGTKLMSVSIGGKLYDQARPESVVPAEGSGYRIQLSDGTQRGIFRDKTDADAEMVRQQQLYDKGSPQLGFTITPAMRERVAEGLPLFQKNIGSFDPSSLTVALLNGANLSTVLHEGGHFYLRALELMSAMPEATQQMKDDFDATMRWFGLTREEWQSMSVEQQRPYHEQWAQSQERWMLEGRSPTMEMQSVFARFRSWLLNIYKSTEQFLLQNPLAGKLNDEIRGVFSRLIAAEEAIVQAEQARGYSLLFTSEQEAVAQGISAQAYREYVDRAKRATEDGIDDLQRRSLRDMKWLSNARSKALRQLQKQASALRAEIKDQVSVEVLSEPVQQARTFLRTGEMVDPQSGEQIKVTEGYKLNRAAVEALLPTGELGAVDVSKLRGMTAPDGLDPELVARMFGFDSADRFLRELSSAEDANGKIEGLTDQRMLEQHGEFVDQRALEQAADQAVHNEARARFMATGLKMLSKTPVSSYQIAKAAKEAALRTVAGKRVRDIRAAQYAAAEGRLNKEALRLAPTDPLAASEAQHKALLNNRLAQAALDAQDEVAKMLRYVSKFKNEGTRKALDVDYLEQIDELLAAFDPNPATTLKEIGARQSLVAWVAQQEELGFEPTIDPVALAEAKRTSYKQMTLEQLRGFVDAIKEIEHYGRMKKKLLTAQDAREFATRMQEARDSIVANANRTVEEKGSPQDAVERTGQFFRWMAAAHRKFSSVVREMDGGRDNGVMWSLLVRNMNEAATNETQMKAAGNERLTELFAPIMKSIQSGLLPGGIYARKTSIPGTDFSMTDEQRIMFAMNWGNEGNRQRLLDGGITGRRGISAQEANAVLDTLTKEQWDFVQGVWDYFESFRPAVAEQERQLTGKTPEWVEPAPVYTRFGTYRGGYFPAKYDTVLSTRSEALEAVTNLRLGMKGAFNAAATRNGYTKARSAQVVGRPLLLSFNAISQHVSEVTHRLAWQAWLVDASRTLRALDGTIREHYGAEIFSELRQTVADIAKGDAPAQTPVEVAINRVRIGSTIVGMGWRFATALLQPTGLAQSWSRVGGRWVARGLKEYLANPVDATDRVRMMSPFMQERGRTINREINEVLNTVRAGETLSAIEASYFGMIGFMQATVDIPTWLGAYEKSLEQQGYETAGNAEQREAIERTAVAVADQAVIDSQSGGELKDLASVQRGGPAQKLWTNFYSYFSATYNLNVEAYRRTRFTNPVEVGVFLKDMVLLNIVPVLFSVALHQLTRGKCELDDMECLIGEYAQEQLNYLFGQMVLLRELGAAASAATGGETFGYSGPAGLRFFSDVYKAGVQIHQGEPDMAAFKAMNNVAGSVLHYPAGQINNTVEGLIAAENGDVEGGAIIPALLFGPPR